MTLAIDIGRRSKFSLIRSYISLDMSFAWRGALRKIGIGKLQDIELDDYQAPDSDLCNKAKSLVTALSPAFLVQHCERTYAFGAILAKRNNLKFDAELLYLASIMHDLGLTETHKDEPGSFEWVSAKHAHKFCLDNQMEKLRAALVHDAIALHASVGIAGSKEPEIAMVHFGAGMDLMGMRLKEVPKFALENVLERYPRDGFKSSLACCVTHQAETKPDSQIAGHVDLGLLDRVLDELT